MRNQRNHSHCGTMWYNLMQDGQAQRFKTRVLTALLVPCVVAASLVAATPPASGHHDSVSKIPLTETYRDPNPDWSSDGDWTRLRHNCGLWGQICGNDFWVSTTQGAKAEWYLPNMQGVYTFSRTLPKHFTSEKYPATGTVEWTIWEFRKGATSYQKVATFTPPSQRNRLGWYTYHSHRIELDGAVKITAEARESGKRVGVQHVRLNHVDVLPEHLELAKDMCVDGDDDLQDRLEKFAAYLGVSLTLAAAIVVKVFVPGIGDATLAAAIVNAAKVAGVVGVTLDVATLAAKELLDAVYDRERRKEGYCGDFDADLWWQGYAKFSDDIAELSNEEREYATFGCTYLPTRRTPNSMGTALCKPKS